MPHIAMDPLADAGTPGLSDESDPIASLTGNASVQQQLETEFCDSLSKFGITSEQIDAFKQGDSDLFFSLNQKSEVEIKYIEKESEYFVRCVKAEEASEELEQENKKLHAQVNDLKYQLAKMKVEGEKIKAEKEKLKEIVEALRKEIGAKEC
eukprot:Phypoly_transcript_21451.p1 GENE.Phypoly_transcript_21451~~Phypoly_transcript_21451.p1  ORF type:complete len:152 (+),score=37.63 Phypoly_transcript_21451:94-549(+)